MLHGASKKLAADGEFSEISLKHKIWCQWMPFFAIHFQLRIPGPRCIKLTINGNFTFNGNYHENKTP